MRGKDDKAIIEAFKSSKDLEELQIEFSSPIFGIGKIYVCRVFAASKVKLRDLVK